VIETCLPCEVSSPPFVSSIPVHHLFSNVHSRVPMRHRCPPPHPRCPLPASNVPLATLARAPHHPARRVQPAQPRTSRHQNHALLVLQVHSRSHFIAPAVQLRSSYWNLYLYHTRFIPAVPCLQRRMHYVPSRQRVKRQQDVLLCMRCWSVATRVSFMTH
jgi:hypothetical protein